jgi:hypothetical protein
MKHLQHRPEDWATATDEQWIDALLDWQSPVDPRWMRFAEQRRPDCLRRALSMHAQINGPLGVPARRWLRTGRVWL